MSTDDMAEPLAQKPEPESKPLLDSPRSAILFLAGFMVLWLIAFAIFRATPLLSSASNVIKYSVQNYVRHGKAFPASYSGTTLAILGNSRVLSGFIPDQFDQMASRENISVYSFDYGQPGARDQDMVDELNDLTESGRPPDVVLLTYPWGDEGSGIPVFHLNRDDNDIATAIFPFRSLGRNVVRFLVNSRRFGGPVKLYQMAKASAQDCLSARGHYFIKELAVYPSHRMPDNYVLASDSPNTVAAWRPDFNSGQLARINQIVEQYKLRCYFVPTYYRTHQAAPPPSINAEFAAELAQHSSCRDIGPDYILYPPALFSDPIHVNPDGARVYTQDIYKLVAPYLEAKH